MIKKYIKNQLIKDGKRIEKFTSRNEILGLIKKLYPKKFHGNLIRLGGVEDGGYLVPDDFFGIEACFSPGVDKISEFELDCYKRGMKLFLADKSVEKPNLEIPESEYDFIKKFISCYDNDEYITMDTWINSKDLEKKSDLILQMDIEGSEYHSLINISTRLLNRFRIIVIELHFLDRLWEPAFFNAFETVINKLTHNHSVVHAHPNNCCGVYNFMNIPIPRIMEFTFLRNDRGLLDDYEKQFPNTLDRDCTENESIHIPQIWYSPDCK